MKENKKNYKAKVSTKYEISQSLPCSQIIDTPFCRFSANIKVFFQIINCPYRKTFEGPWSYNSMEGHSI